MKGAFELVFVESQGASSGAAELFAYERGWMGSGALWTTERPTNSGLGYLPSFVLLDGDGKVLMKGNTADMKSKIEEAIEDWVDDRTDLPDAYPKSFKKAWRAYVEGEYAKSLTLLGQIEAKGKEDASAVPELRELVNEACHRDFDRLAGFAERGLFVELEREAERISEQIEGIAVFEELLTASLEPLHDEANQGEVEAARDLDKLMGKVLDKGIDKHRKALTKFAKKHAGTKAAERAERLAKLS